MPIPVQVHSQLVDAGLPALGVSIGRRNDKTTWRVDYSEPPSDQQRQDAQAVIDAFDVEQAEADDVTARSTAAACAQITAADLLALLVTKGVLAKADLPPELSSALDIIDAEKTRKGRHMTSRPPENTRKGRLP